jgi:hypothetical protein
MAIIWAETFNKYGTDKALMLNGLWGQVFANLTDRPRPYGDW